MSKTAELRIITDGLGVLLARPDRLACWIDELGFVLIVYKAGFVPDFSYVGFRRDQEVHCSCVELRDPSLLFCRRTGVVICLAYKRVHERKREMDCQLVYHELRLPSTTVCFNSNFC